jgi:hypothetical protein
MIDHLFHQFFWNQMLIMTTNFGYLILLFYIFFVKIQVYVYLNNSTRPIHLILQNGKLATLKIQFKWTMLISITFGHPNL